MSKLQLMKVRRFVKNLARFQSGWGLCLSLWLSVSVAMAQRPNGKFLSDTIKIGYPIQFALSYRHPADQEVFFPDTNWTFRPFDCIKREFFTTQTDQRGSLDSVVYTLVSFEVDKVQQLSLPIFVWSKRDCTAVYSPADSVVLHELISGNPAKLSLKADTHLLHVEQQTNYPLILLVIIGSLLIGVIIFWLFGETIRRQIRFFQLRRRHSDFLRSFQRLQRGIAGKAGIGNVEKSVVLWKKYVERLEQKPFSSFTTKEITDNIPDERLADALRQIDVTIYGGAFSPQTQASLEVLQELAIKIYRHRRRELALESRRSKERETISA
ncbi:MAG: hypothetical protein U0Y10_06360 [Spirosomataceae bacterium]